jgi:hypothetical protein
MATTRPLIGKRATAASRRPAPEICRRRPVAPGSWLRREGSAYAFLSLYALLFIIFIVVPVLAAVLLSFTFFDTIQPPTFIGLRNYVALLTPTTSSCAMCCPTR